MIKIHNDGKQKHQSFEALIEFSYTSGYGDFHCYISGFGSTEEEAIKNVKDLYVMIPVIYNNEIEGDIQYVDYKGDPIK